MDSTAQKRQPEQHFIDRLSQPWFRAIVKAQHSIHTTTHRLWSQKSYNCMNLPLTTGSISSPMGLGSDSTPVKIELFGEETYLADSMQFALELGCRIAGEGCYYIMPSFRGEANDPTHLSQFFHSELELVGNLATVIRVVEEYLKELSQGLLETCGGSIFPFAKDLSHIEQFVESGTPIQQITFKDARKYLKDDPLYIKECCPGAYSITREGEARLLRDIAPILWLTHFDHLSVPFYQAYTDDSKQTAAAADLLMGPGEVVGCGERHSSGDQVLESLLHHGVARSEYEWYVQMKEKTPLQTSGFGLGIERFLMWAFKHDDIRDFQILPRENGKTILP